MDIDPPLTALLAMPLAQLGNGSGMLFALGLLLSVASGAVAGITLVGIARRSIGRTLGWRGLTAVSVSLALGVLALASAFYSGRWPFSFGAAAFSDADTAGRLADTLAYSISGAFIAAILAGLFLGLLARFAPRESAMLRLPASLAPLFTPGWIGRRGGTDGETAEPEFEITMASGEEVEAEERALIENILEMGDTTVREVMKPRPDVSAMGVDWAAERILAEVAGSHLSRFPVYEETIDNVVGVLHLRDLFEFVARGDGLENFDLRSLIKDPWFIPESKKVDEALRELQRQKGHLAIVLDEFGGTAGIVTIEDLLEEIVGEIQDEYDEESKMAHQRDDGSWVVTAQLPIDDLNEILGSSLTAEDVDTAGGLVVDRLGRIPQAQETLDLDGLRFTVLSVEKNRIGRLKVERLPVGPGRSA